jgi:hypothetical protein
MLRGTTTSTVIESTYKDVLRASATVIMIRHIPYNKH